MKTRFLVASLLAICVVSAGYTASGSTIAECQAIISDLKADTEQFEFTQQKDETGLLAKLDGANTKLGLGKFADAVKKLADYKDKIVALDSQGKISPPPSPSTLTTGALLSEADSAIGCIDGI